MNSIVMSYDKTDWRPDYYVIIDGGVAKNIFVQKGRDYDLWHNIDASNVLVSDNFRELFTIPSEVLAFPHIREIPSNRRNKFSDNFYERVCEGHTVTYSCIQLAVYMGCKEIYLLGVDCSFTGTNDHAFNYKMSNEGQNMFLEHGDEIALRQQKAYKAAKDYADSHGIKIYNATRGGKLEVFERISLEEAIKA